MVATQPASHQRTVPALSEADLVAAQGSGGVSGTDILETQQLSSGKSAEELKKLANNAEAKRTEKFRDHFERLSLWTLYIVWFALITMGLIWVYHLVTPDCMHLLLTEQIEKLQTFLTGGVIAGVASGHTKRRLTNGNET